MNQESEFLQHEPCPDCGSSDANSRYTDGHTYCFACGHHEQGDKNGNDRDTVSCGDCTVGDSKRSRSRHTVALIEGEVRPLLKRKITQETCAKFDYMVGKLRGKTVQIAPYRDEEGRVVAQHIRTASKDFPWLGDPKEAVLFGQHLWKDGGRRVVVTEGELDCMSISQLQGNKWPVVSIGCGAAKPEHVKKVTKYIARFVTYLEKFDEVIFAFDMDDQGRASAKAAAAVLSPGKAKIASYPLHDANDMLLAGRGQELMSALWNAQEFRPDGLLRMRDVIARAKETPQMGREWPWEGLTALTYGRRPGRLNVWGAATGAGKTDFMMQVVAHLHETYLDEKIGVFFLENDVGEVGRYLAGKIDAKLYNAPKGTGWTQEELDERLEWLDKQDRVIVYDNFGSCEWDIIKGHIRYLAKSWGMTSVMIDHLSALASAEDDERLGLERIMPEIAMLTKELGLVTDIVSHLATPDGKPHEEGGRVMIRHFRGSRTIGYWAHNIFGLERDQQAEDEGEKLTTSLRILKCRDFGSNTGKLVPVRYDPTTGMLTEQTFNPFEGTQDGEFSDLDDEVPF